LLNWNGIHIIPLTGCVFGSDSPHGATDTGVLLGLAHYRDVVVALDSVFSVAAVSCSSIFLRFEERLE